eukprot:symbB.v1.2.017225.t1/scaffold1309.1/size125903/2
MPRRCRQPLVLAGAGGLAAAGCFTLPSQGPASRVLGTSSPHGDAAPFVPRVAPSPSSCATVAGSALALALGAATRRRGGKTSMPRHFFGETEQTTETTTEEVHQKVTQHPPGSRIPEGTPEPHPMSIRKRPRRNRRSVAQREMFAETRLTASNFILPIFVHEGADDIPISSMPGVSRVGVDTGLLREVEEAVQLGVKSVVLFPKTPDELKTQTAEECYNPEGLAQRAIRNVKQAFPDVVTPGMP